MAATYQLSNFLASPSTQDVRLRIYDKSSKLRYTIDPNVSYFFKKANIVIIKINNKNDVYLDFASSTEATQALTILNDAKRVMTTPTCDPGGGTGGSITVYSKSNLNMPGLVTVANGDLACNNTIIDEPLHSSHVRVFINGVEVNIGGKDAPHDGYFSPDGGLTARILGDERQGDKLYWNGSYAGYQLDTQDFIDFVYLISVD